ncbi:MAG: hypothetical protein KGY99_02820 [Phycisphaerae bacterium]|nr:hypothetical protein [Phycisphaerae bacterium]
MPTQQPRCTRRLATGVAALTMALTIGLVGCAPRKPSTITGGETAAVDGDNSAAFLDRVADAKSVTLNDAVTGMCLLTGAEAGGDFATRVRLLRGREVLAGGAVDATAPVTRGQLAYMVYQAADVPGGVILTLTGPSERYCLRELQYRGMMTDGLANTPVSGMEYVAVLTRAKTYMQTGHIRRNRSRLYGGGMAAP